MTGRRVIRPITMDGRLRLDGVRSQFGSEGRSGSSMCTNQLINRYLICADPSCILSINTSPHQSFAMHSLHFLFNLQAVARSNTTPTSFNSHRLYQQWKFSSVLHATIVTSRSPRANRSHPTASRRMRDMCFFVSTTIP